MAVFKCKMCGGTLEINENESIAVCEYCGTKQTIPKLGNEKRANLYDRANHFRRNNDYDKAMNIYEQILNEDNTDAEAYWSLVLCRYGIEYIEDPATHKRVPTVNRAQFTSIFDDDNYQSALQYADGSQKSIYEEEAKAINEIQKGILAISQKEEPFDVFICYKETDNNGRRTPDSVLANDLYHQLTLEGFKVFFARITLEDKLGSAYEPYIFAALNSAKVMVVLGTKPEYFNAVWVKNEWSRYLTLVKQSGGKKMLIPAYKDMDPYDLPDEFSHLQAQDMSKLGFMQDLIRGIKKIAQSEMPKTTVVKETLVSGGNNQIAPLLKRAFMFLEDGDWSSADEYCEKVLDMDPENADAYLGKLMAELHIRKQENLADSKQPFRDSNNYRKALRFANNELADKLQEYCKKADSNEREIQLKEGYYTGEAVKNIPHGHGKCTFTNGDIYEGNWTNGVRSGVGIYTWANGDVYQGSFLNNQKSGNGTLTWIQGGTWNGEWRNDLCWSGSGTYYYPNGRFEGRYLNGKRDGEGIFVWNIGGILRGEWREGKFLNGSGRSYEYNNNKTIKENAYYEGEIRDGKRNGRGTFVDYSGSIHTEESGEWQEGVLYNGTYIRKTSDSTYKCTVKNGVRGGCYVATAVYDSYDCPEVWTLRRYRDNTLAETWHGRAFIRTYYAVSPTLVKWFGHTEWFKKMWKGTLDRMVSRLNADGVADTPYEDKHW